MYTTDLLHHPSRSFFWWGRRPSTLEICFRRFTNEAVSNRMNYNLYYKQCQTDWLVCNHYNHHYTHIMYAHPWNFLQRPSVPMYGIPAHFASFCSTKSRTCAQFLHRWVTPNPALAKVWLDPSIGTSASSALQRIAWRTNWKQWLSCPNFALNSAGSVTNPSLATV